MNGQTPDPYGMKTCRAEQFEAPVAALQYVEAVIFSGEANAVIIRDWLGWRQKFEPRTITAGKHSTRLNPGYYIDGDFRRCARPAYEDGVAPVMPQGEAIYKFGSVSYLLWKDFNDAIQAPHPWSVDVRQDFERTKNPDNEHWHHDGISYLSAILTTDGAGSLLSRGKNALMRAYKGDLCFVATQASRRKDGTSLIPNWHRGPTLSENIEVNGSARRTSYVVRSEPV